MVNVKTEHVYGPVFVSDYTADIKALTCARMDLTCKFVRQ